MGARRRLTTFAMGAAGFALLTAGLTAGLTTGQLGRDAVAGELPTFDDCAQLRQWYVDQAIPLVGPYGFGGGQVVPLTARSEASASLDSAAAVGSSGTGTNTQEADVDESDVAKTDGSLVVRVVDRSLVVTDVSGGTPVELSRTRLPGPALVRPELLLHDDRVVVVGDELGPGFGWPEGAAIDRTFLPGRPADTRAHVISFDLADPASPRVTDERVVDGGALSTREYADGTVRVVVTTGFPPLDFVQPNRDRTPAQATRRNRELVRATGIEDWLPGMRTDGGAKRPLLACSDVRHPLQASGFGTISVLTFPFDEPDRTQATAVTAAGDLVYSSASRLYVATTSGGPVLTTGDAPVPRVATTQVHAFALDGGGTTYTASGSFRGTVKDRWSFSEHDGRLRVAAEIPRDQGPADNGVLVLAERDGRLVETGRVDGLGRGESIRSVRWFGDLAIVVTFRETDPLYTVDLTDPDRPRVVGELKAPGFSSYLHPVGGGLLVGVGHTATVDGSDLGAQAATFDLRNLSAVHRMATLGFGPSTDVAAGVDPRAFSYLPDARVLVTPVQDWADGGSRFVALRVGADGSLTETGSWVTRGYGGQDVRTLPLGGSRVALVGDVVRVVDVR